MLLERIAKWTRIVKTHHEETPLTLSRLPASNDGNDHGKIRSHKPWLMANAMHSMQALFLRKRGPVKMASLANKTGYCQARAQDG